MSRCGSCRAPVHWAIAEATGRRMPLDADAASAPLWVDDGNVYLVRRERDGTPVVAVLRKGQVLDPDTPRWRSHFATCAHAGEHRRTARARPPERATLEDAAKIIPFRRR